MEITLEYCLQGVGLAQPSNTKFGNFGMQITIEDAEVELGMRLLNLIIFNNFWIRSTGIFVISAVLMQVGSFSILKEMLLSLVKIGMLIAT